MAMPPHATSVSAGEKEPEVVTNAAAPADLGAGRRQVNRLPVDQGTVGGVDRGREGVDQLPPGVLVHAEHDLVHPGEGQSGLDHLASRGDHRLEVDREPVPLGLLRVDERPPRPVPRLRKRSVGRTPSRASSTSAVVSGHGPLPAA